METEGDTENQQETYHISISGNIRCLVCGETRAVSLFGLTSTKSFEKGSNFFITVHESWKLEERKKTSQLLRSKYNDISVNFFQFESWEVLVQ